MQRNERTESVAGRLCGIDFGTVRVGIALTDSRRTIASPMEVYVRADEASDSAFFQALAERERISKFVVGLPVHLSGDESAKSIEARQFGDWLARITGVTVIFFDERFSTRQADQLLNERGLTRNRRRARRDMLAAQIMLTEYLEAGQPESPAPEPLDDH